jgi:hypothetical protein
MILQAISNYLDKHSIKHTTHNIHIDIQPNSKIIIWHHPNNNTITISNPKTTPMNTHINLANPELLPKILQIIQQ